LIKTTWNTLRDEIIRWTDYSENGVIGVIENK